MSNETTPSTTPKMFRILHRFTAAVIFSAAVDTAKEAVLLAAQQGVSLAYADLSRANLSDANLSDADLSDADLSRANLSRANLSRANLSDANLSAADLSDADLSRANLSRANLSDADLSDADLSRANLSAADLSRANLSRANLSDADLSRAKEDLFAACAVVPNEVPGLLRELRAGRVDGSVYTGDCACFVGTVANLRGVHYEAIPELKPMAWRPVERWFLGIQKGDTPESSQIAKITEEWLEEWLAKNPPMPEPKTEAEAKAAE